MNDRCVSLLDNYDIEVLRTWKGRGAILCEAKEGLFILKEYAGHRERAVFQDALLRRIRENGFAQAETIVQNKEQELLTTEQDGTLYILKTYFEGRECNVRDQEECRQAVGTLARFHQAAVAEEKEQKSGTVHDALWEFEKHNRELKKIKRYLKEKGQKTDFELCLMKTYEPFFQLALQVTQELAASGEGQRKIVICHGDYQHHNIILSDGGMNLINFEKCLFESPVRDLYLFLRKILEKSNWDEKTGLDLVRAYEKVCPMEEEEYRQLFYRLLYPEKFWKIVNFYYNSNKAWIPGKNLEKLIRVVEQEKDKKEFLEKFKNHYGLSCDIL